MRIAAFILAATACQAAEKPAVMELPRVRLAVITASGARHALTAEVAADDATRARGLMHRKQLGLDAGMLFVFPQAAVQSFWMKNTLIPLDMIFVDDELVIVGIVERAQPLTLTGRGVPAPSRYVLEVAGGWSAARGVQVGDRLQIADPLPVPAATGSDRGP